MQRRAWVATAAAVLVSLGALSACGSDDSGSTDTASDAAAQTTTAAAGGGAIEAARAVYEEAIGERTKEDAQFPAASPPPVAGKTLAAVQCGAVLEGCRIVSEGHVEAAKALGWKTQLFDGKGTPQGWNDAISQALQTKPDVLALGAILPSAVADVLAKAKKQGVTVVCSVCGVTDADKDVDVATGEDFNEDIGRYSAAFMLAETGDETQALLQKYPEFGVSLLRHGGAEEMIATCAECSSETVEVKASEFGTTLGGRIQGLLQKNPDVQWVFAPGDFPASDVAQAITAAGLADKVRVVGGNGEKQSFQQVREGTPYAAIGAVSYQLAAWQAVDNANRVLAGEEQVPVKSPVRLITKENIGDIPEGGYYEPFDFRTAYAELWKQ